MVHELLTRLEIELSTLAATGLANAGPALVELKTLSDELAAARLGRLGERLQAIGQAGEDRSRTAAWVAAWTGVGLVRTRLLKPQSPDPGDVLALPQAPNVVFPRPAGDLGSVDGLLAILQSPDFLARVYATGRLAEFGDEAVPGLLVVQQTCGRCIRFLAIEALARIGTSQALAGLVGLLGDGDVARPLEAALLGLGEQAVEFVAGALAQAKDKRRRQAAAKLLWRLGPAERLQPCLGDGDELVQAYAQAALWPVSRLAKCAEQQNNVASIPAAVVLFERKLMNAASLAEQLDTLAKNRLADAAAVLWHTAAEPPALAHYLVQTSGGSRSRERERAAVLVAHLANLEALETLFHVSEQNTSLIISALTELGDGTASWRLLQYAEQLTGYWQDMIIPALGRIGDPAAVSYLVATLRTARSQSSRDSAEQALSEIGSPAAGAVGQALLHLEPAEQAAAPALERILAKIGTPEAKTALQSYRKETDELARLLRHLADGKEAKKTIGSIARLGAEALEPLLDMAASGNQGQSNAVRTLTRLAPALSDEQRQRTAAVLLQQLCQHRQQTSVRGSGRVDSEWARVLVSALCELEATNAAAEFTSMLTYNGVSEIVAEYWRRTRRPWLLDVLAQGLQIPNARWDTLQAIKAMTPEEQVIQALWPPIEAILQTESDVLPLLAAVECARAWGDPRAVPALRSLKQRRASVSGADWFKRRFNQEIGAALAELNKKRSLKDRLLGR